MKHRLVLLSAILALSLSPSAHAQATSAPAQALGSVVQTVKGGISLAKQFISIISDPSQLLAQISDFTAPLTEGLSTFLLGDAQSQDGTFSLGAISNIIGQDSSDPFAVFQKLEDYPISSGVLFSPYSDSAFADGTNFSTSAKIAFTEGFAKNSLDKKAQARAKQLGEGIKSAVEQSSQLADDAQGLDVTQDVMKLIAQQNEQNTALLGHLGITAIKQEQSTQVANLNFAQANKELSSQNRAREVDIAAQSSDLYRAMRQFDDK